MCTQFADINAVERMPALICRASKRPDTSPFSIILSIGKMS